MKRIALSLLLAFAGMSGAEAKTCNISGGSVAFGAYDPTSPGNLNSTGSVQLNCNGEFNGTLSLGVGNGSGASYGAGRKMTRGGGSGTLTYNLYADAGRSQVFGDGTGGSVTLQVSGNGSLIQAIWARIPGGQHSASSGGYADTVMVTISY